MSSVSGDYRRGGASGIKIARIVVPWIVLALVLVSVLSIVGNYRATSKEMAERADESLALTGTVSPSAKKRRERARLEKEKAAKQVAAKKAGPTVEVVTDGLNFREGPSGSSHVIRTLDQGESLTVVQNSGNWYKARDGKGKEGWVTASTKYVKVKK